MMRPSDFLPPGRPGEFIRAPAAPEEALEAGVLIVGAGVSGLATAIRLAQLVQDAPAVREALGEMGIVVADKGRSPGAHLLSGCVLDPSAFTKLFPSIEPSGLPFFGRVERDSTYFLTRRRAFPVPTPPTMHNEGLWIASIARVGKWLAERAEELGVTILPATACDRLLVDDGRVVGAAVGDKGLDRDGKPLGNFEPGPEIRAGLTVLADGVFGHLTAAALEAFSIARPSPQVFSLGVKEVWEVAQPLDRVVHTLGWPLSPWARWREFGGAFCYPLGREMVSIGLVVGLDHADSSLSVHDLLQQLKRHPLFSRILKGGKRHERGWGAKCIPEGGFHALPEKLSMPGALVVGDAAGFVNVPTLKGVHYAMWSGIMAAEAMFERLSADPSGAGRTPITAYDERIRSSFIAKDLWAVRNVRPAFRHGLFMGGAVAGLALATGGRFPSATPEITADGDEPIVEGVRRPVRADGVLTFDKVSSVHASGNRNRDDLPCHLRLAPDLPAPIGRMLVNMCPAAVYEWNDEARPGRLVVQATNCIHCGAIGAKGGKLTPPEGGSGPDYSLM